MNKELSLKLKSRHMIMIAIGSAIGTGLFFGMGKSLALAGPSIILSYLIGGIIMYIVVRALGEMTVHEPSSGSFSYYAYRYFNSYAGFIAGWNYWFNYIIVCMLELSATSIFLDKWFYLPHWITALCALVIFTLINLCTVKLFGEFEFWFAGIKVVVIIALIILGIFLITSSHETHSSISNLWKDNGFFAKGFTGFLFSFIIVIFSFGGTELVCIASGEAKNPQTSIPKAINGIIARILIFYVLTIAIIICLYPWNQINAAMSPFVDVFTKVGITKAANFMNLIAITASLSSLNSGIYGTARMLFNLSTQGNAPIVFSKLSKNGSPRNAIIFSILCIFITVILDYFFEKQIFIILLSIATGAAIINWLIILITHIRFRSKVCNDEIIYKMPFYPLLSIIAIIFFILAIVIMMKMDDMRTAIYVIPVWLALLSIMYMIHKKIMYLSKDGILNK